MTDHTLSENCVLQAIRKSLRGTARQILIPLGESASSSGILAKLDGLFGNVSSNESIMQTFYTASQRDGESVTAYGCRLESLLQTAINNGHVSVSAKDDMLRSKFWSGLRSDALKSHTRHKYDSIKTFDVLLREIRAIDFELGMAHSKSGPGTAGKVKSIQHQPAQHPTSDEQRAIDKLSHQMSR